MPTSELTDTSLNIAGTTTIKGIESILTNNASLAATSSAILTAINNSASNVSSYVDNQINSNINYIARGNVSGGNLNNLISCGSYNIDNCSNSPCTYGKLFVEGDAANSWLKQTVANILSPYQIWHRIKNANESWTSWQNEFNGVITNNYLRLNENKIQICWGIGMYGINSWDDWGYLKEAMPGMNIEFAVPFDGVPTVVASGYTWAGAGASVEINGVNATHIIGAYLLRPGNVGANPDTTALINYFALGKWA